MDPQSVYERLITRAAAQLGGLQALAQRLDISQEKLEGWVAGREEPDMPTVLRILEIALDG